MREKAGQQRGMGLVLLVMVTGISVICLFWMQEYRKAAFHQFSCFCQLVAKEEPEALEPVLLALKEYQEYSKQQVMKNDFLTQYGYRVTSFSKGLGAEFAVSALAFFFVSAGVFLLFAAKQRKRLFKRIQGLTDYLEQGKRGEAPVFPVEKEDWFSRLQDQMYKTVTELYQTREEAVLAQRQFGENLANIAHQLKTPITAALLSLELMEKAASVSKTDSVKRPLLRLMHLEEALLTLSKIDSGNLILEQNKVDAYTVLALASENLEELLSRRSVTVEIPEKSGVEFTGDLEWTMEAVMNLMKNCMEHSPEGGCIHCDYVKNPLYTEMVIWDEGEGFEKEELPYLFRRFYRGKRAGAQGNGIGLALARQVLELENGILTAKNLPEGGACFEIRIYRH